MNASELESVFNNLMKWPETASVRSRNFIEVWTALDDVLNTRLLEFDTKTQLKFADYVYHIHLSKQFDYTYNLVSRCSKKYKYLTPQELVQTLFYISTSRKAPPNMINFELLLKNYYEQLTIDEISIICMGFFKSKSCFRSHNLIEKILQIVSKEAGTINEVALCAILKMIKYSLKRFTPRLVETLDSLTQQIPRLSLLCCVHIALAGTSILEFHKESLDAIANKFVKNPSDLRLKDLERFAFSCSLYTYIPPTDVSIFDIIVQELRTPLREKEICRHGTSLVNCLVYLGTMGIYPLDLIDKCFSEEFIRTAYTFKESQYGKSLITLNNSVAIECKDYNGNRLCPKINKRLAKQLADYIPDPTLHYKLTMAEKTLVDVMAILEKTRGGKNYVTATHLLPHFSMGDIVVCNDMNGKPVDVQNSFPGNNFGSIQYAPTSNCKWFAICIGPRPPTPKYEHGPRIMKTRQLKAIGFVPIYIYMNHWAGLRSEEEKIKFLTEAFRSVQLQPNQIKHKN